MTTCSAMGDAVAVGVGQETLGVCKNSVILTVGIHAGKGAAVPLQRGGSGTQQRGGMGVEDLAVLQAGFGLLKLIGGEKVGGETGGLCGLLDLFAVGFLHKTQIDTNITAHTALSS
jgi:hypothetical protein